MTPEIRLLWLLTVLCVFVMMLVAGYRHPQAQPQTAIEAVFGPVPPAFTTRRVPARDLLDGPTRSAH